MGDARLGREPFELAQRLCGGERFSVPAGRFPIAAIGGLCCGENRIGLPSPGRCSTSF